MGKGSTPAMPQRGTRFDGFVLEVGVPPQGTGGADQVARAAVDAVLGPGWTVEPLYEGAPEFLVLYGPEAELPTVGESFTLARELGDQPGVASAEPDLLQPGIDPRSDQVDGLPVPESAGSAPKHATCSVEPDWALKACRVPQAWELDPPDGGLRFGSGIVIAHPDTGYSMHPEIFSDRLLTAQGYDFEDDREDPVDSLSGQAPGHGTATASVAMSARGSQATWEPVDGIAPEAQLVPYRVSTSVVHLRFTNVARAIHRAVDQGQHVISMSLGGPFGPRYLRRAVQRAVREGIVVISAAGNVWPWVIYPGRFPETVCVAASNCHGAVWDDSASGSTVDVTAPGESVWRARIDSAGQHSTGRSSGTSYATAMMAGACALWLAYHGRDRLIETYGTGGLASAFKRVLVNHGVWVPAGWDTGDHGAGILDVEALLQAPLPPVSMAVPEAVEERGLVDDVQQIAVYFPDLTPSEVRQALTRFLNLEEEALDAGVRPVAEEISFRCAVDPEFRLAVRRGAKAAGLESVAAVDRDVSVELRSLMR